jgi:2,5-dioxopentanoate dehydrogenase
MFKDATRSQINKTLTAAHAAFADYKQTTPQQRAAFLRTIATEMEALGDDLIHTAMSETNLPYPRLIGERGRTTGQLRLFADLITEGSWCEAYIDTAQPDRQPLAKPDLRKMLVPIGTVVVFGASNFPFAYSTAGGDTASALAAGCPVVIKAHPAHAATSAMVATAVAKAIKKHKMPKATFQHVFGASQKVGKDLVQHPLTAAVGFTGSFAGGKALFDIANKRPVPIPVFAEMGSVNPVVLLPEIMSQNPDGLAKALAASATLGMGQFCTKPGLIFTQNTEGGKKFAQTLGESMAAVDPQKMLHVGIASAFEQKSTVATCQNGVTLLGKSPKAAETGVGLPQVAVVSGAEFLKNSTLHQEVFGPYALVIQCDSKPQLLEIITHLEGQLTASVFGNDSELVDNQDIIKALENITGRLIFNGVPTGVEVAGAMQHGGPFPASTDGRFGAVGPSAIKRFARPVSFQNCPESLLPDALKTANPLGIWRIVDGVFQK